MTTVVKRAIRVIAIVLSAIVLLCSLGGLVGLWMLQRQIREITTAVFAPIDSGLATVNKALSTVNGRVTAAKSKVADVQQSVDQLGQNPVFDGSVVGSIADALNTKLGPQIDETRESVGNAVQFAVGINNSIEALNKLPRVNLPTLTDQLQTLQTRLTTLDERVQQLRADLGSMRQEKLQQIPGTRIKNLLGNVTTALENINEAANKQSANIERAQSRVTDLKCDISIWITIAWIAGTLFLGWIAISQVVMLRWACSLAHRPKVEA